MALHPIPHTEEWFKALGRFNPAQGEATRTIIKLAGRVDVCSICGDGPAKDYKLVGEKLSSKAVATIRLCDDWVKSGAHNMASDFLRLRLRDAPPAKSKYTNPIARTNHWPLRPQAAIMYPDIHAMPALRRSRDYCRCITPPASIENDTRNALASLLRLFKERLTVPGLVFSARSERLAPQANQE